MCKFDPSRPVQTRDGRPARIIATNVANEKYPVIALITMGAGIEEPQSFTAKGRYVSDTTETAADLVNVPEETVEFRTVSFRNPTHDSLWVGSIANETAEDAHKLGVGETWDAVMKITARDGKLVGLELVDA